MFHKVCLVSREIDGLAGAGGLKDVVRGLADALDETGCEVTAIIPRYGFIDIGDFLYILRVPLGERTESVDVYETRISGIRIHLLDAACFSSKQDIYIYTEGDAPDKKHIGAGHIDADEMNILFQASAVMDIMKDSSPPEIIHGHDGHTGLLPLFMKKFGISSGFFNHTAVLITIHNAGTAYQQMLGKPESVAVETGLPVESLTECMMNNHVNPLLCAGIFGYINTVSPGYARELLSGRDEFSGDLGRVFHEKRIPLKGVYNGIDPTRWQHPGYQRKRRKQEKYFLRNKILNDAIRLKRYGGIRYYGGEPSSDLPWIVFHGRLTRQKGVDSLLDLPMDLQGFKGRFNLIFYGRGEGDIVDDIRTRVSESADWFFWEGYNSDLTIQLIAAASFVVVPSRWEPCGQIDMIGQLLGALPIVRSVGGLKKIRHLIDGFRYSPGNNEGLLQNLNKALDWEWNKQRRLSLMRRYAENIVYGRRIWRKILIRGYFPLYRKARRRIRQQRNR